MTETKKLSAEEQKGRIKEKEEKRQGRKEGDDRKDTKREAGNRTQYTARKEAKAMKRGKEGRGDGVMIGLP